MAVFSEAFLRLRQELDRSHESRQKLIEDIRGNVRDMARQTGRASRWSRAATAAPTSRR